MYEGCLEIIKKKGRKQTFLKSYKFRFWSMCSTEYLCMDFKLF